MKNVHPRVLEAVLARLPSGAEVVGATPENTKKTLFLVKLDDGRIKRALMDKIDVSTYLGTQVVELEVEEGIGMWEVMELLSRKYRLFLVPQVDYAVGDNRIVFGEQQALEQSVTILDNSVSLTGTVTFTLRHKTKSIKQSGSVGVLLETQKTQIALAAKVFEVKEGAFLKDEQLTQSFSQEVVEYLSQCQLKVTPDVKELTGGSVLGVLNDGISDFLAFKSTEGQTWYIRFVIESADTKVPQEEPA